MLLTFLVLCLLSSQSFAHSMWDDMKGLLTGEDTQFVCYSSFHRSIYLLVVLLSLALAVVALYGFRTKKKANDMLSFQNLEIQKQKEEIETQRDDIDQKSKYLQDAYKQITDSVKYAQRIQQALLPSPRQLREQLPDSLLIFRPRDIVSGDFYWFHRKGTLLTVIVADCTGHGVPGAIMSIVANEMLNRVIVQEENTQPARILQLLNQYMMSALQKNDNVADDGLELAVCSICSQQKKVWYAGAKMPLYYVRDEQINEIKPTKLAIGGMKSEGEKVFEEHCFDFLANDRLFMCSDGCSDQLGGEQNKKFLTRRLRELIASTSAFPFDEQKMLIEKEFDGWKNKNRQTDDITLLGFSLMA